MSTASSFASLLALLAPTVLAAFPQTREIAPQIAQGIAEGEALFGPGSAEQKRAHAQALAATAKDALSKSGVELPDATPEVVGAAIDAVVGTINVVQGTHKAVKVSAPNAPAQ